MSFLSISYIVYCQLDKGANFVLQKAQYDAVGKLSVGRPPNGTVKDLKEHR